MEYPGEVEPVTPFMDVYRANIQSDGSLEKLNLRIVVRGGFQNKEIIGYTWYPTSTMMDLKYFLENDSRCQSRVQ